MKEFEKIIGYSSVKTELECICDTLRNAEKYEKLGVKTMQGILLYGMPGVGKTLMANCFAKATGRKVFLCRKDRPDGDFVNTIREVFEKAKAQAPSIVFLDDMDKFANEDERHVNAEEYVTVQSCIDDVKGCGVFVIATANDIDDLPTSLIRAGRFDKRIYVDVPKGKEAALIVRHYLSDKQYVGDIDPEEIARIMDGHSCAELENVINAAGILAGFAGKEKIDADDIFRACLRTLYDAPESNDENEFVEGIACHEAGHAVISEVLDEGSVTLVSLSCHDGNTKGFSSVNTNDNYFLSKKLMEERVIMLLGGRAATELVYGTVDVGANSDLNRAFRIVERFVDDYCAFGFDKFESHSSSDTLLENKEKCIAAEMDRYYMRAKQILAENRDFLLRLSHALVEKRMLRGSEVRSLRNAA